MATEMDPGRWREVRRVLETALAARPEERAALIESSCGGDTELRTAVCDLLAHEGDGALSLDSPAPGAAIELALKSADGDAVHTHVGPYRLMELIAVGGMGAVYRAVRDDGAYHKEVAVKLIRRGLAGHEMLRRFQRERQVLAGLDHPHITRLLDGGTTADGMPYLVMEYVAGLPIDAYCASRRLDWRGRVELFRTVCLAVHYAHQNLVVHRDLKPGNILVVGEEGAQPGAAEAQPDAGRPKILDFGIAKLLDTQAGRTGQTTEVVGAARTLPYSSPEQIRGAAVTTATDVYSLGVVLYELIAGAPPWDLAAMSRYDAERVICESEPPLMARRLAAEREAPPADLQRIVSMAMHREPGRRYPSAEQLAEDLRRLLEGEPVLAHPPGRLYRLSKLVRRNWAASIAVAAGLTLVLALSVTALLLANRALSAADAETKARASAEQINRFLNQVLASAAPSNLGADATLRRLLENVSERAAVDLSAHPAVAATVYGTLGVTYRHLQDLELAERSLRRALDAYQQLAAGEQIAERAECMTRLGSILTYRNNPEAVELQQRALKLRRQIYGDEHPAIAESLHAVGFALSRCTQPPRYDEAWDYYQQSQELSRRLYGATYEPGPVMRHAMAALRRHQGRLELAATAYETALAAARERHGEKGAVTLEVRADYATCLREMGRWREARRQYEALVPLYAEAFGAEKATTMRAELSRLRLLLGDAAAAQREAAMAAADVLRRAARRHAALAAGLESAAAAMDESGGSALSPSLEALLAVSRELGAAIQESEAGFCSVLMALAEALAAQGHAAAAEPLARESLRLLTCWQPDDPLCQADGEVRLASVLAQAGRADEARRLLQAAVELFSSRRGAEHPYAVDARRRLESIAGQR